MRITYKMMINNSEYWLSKQREKLSDAEIVSAAGQVINKPSDDPEGAAHILEYRSEIAKYGQYSSNLTEADDLISAGTDVLDSVNSLLTEALDLLDSSSSSSASEATLETAKNLYNQILDLANTRYSSNYLYGGSQTDTLPFSDEVSVSSGSAEGIRYYLGSDASAVTITICDSSGNEVRTLSSSGTSGSNTITWDGKDDSGNTLSDGDYTFAVSASDSSGNTVASSCYQGDGGKKQIIIGDGNIVTINSNGGVIFSEALSAISQLIASLEDGTSSDSASATTKSLNSAVSSIKCEMVALSNTSSQLGVTTDRVDKLTELYKERLSTVETGSADQAAVELSAQQTAYEVAQAATAKILNLPRLSDYL